MFKDKKLRLMFAKYAIMLRVEYVFILFFIILSSLKEINIKTQMGVNFKFQVKFGHEILSTIYIDYVAVANIKTGSSTARRLVETR